MNEQGEPVIPPFTGTRRPLRWVEELRRERDEARAALAGLVGCIDQSAADDGPPVTRGSMMAQVCKVIQTTAQYEAARAALVPPAASAGASS